MSDSLFTNGYALIIGVGADLPVTIQDAVVLRNLLVDRNRAAYPTEQVELLTGEEADRKGILDALDRLISQIDGNPQSTVIVYYSGHGAKLEHEDGSAQYFLVPYGYDPNRLDTLVTGNEFTEKIETLNARKLIVLLDCCHAGAIPALKATGKHLIKSPLPEKLLNVLESGSGRVVVTSSRGDEYSYTGTPYSIFTTCLIEALEGKAAVEQDGFARILDILIYLFNKVPQRAPGPQHPFVKKVLDLGDNFPICYYAGGEKHITGFSTESTTIRLGIVSAPKVSPLRRKLLEDQLGGLEKSCATLIRRIEVLRESFIIKADTAVKFQLEHEILEAEAQLIKYQRKMEEIEQVLQ